MKHPKLSVEKRTVLGKKIKTLRHSGIIPANVYGKGLASVPVQLPLTDFQAVYKEVGETGLIDLTFDGKSHPVLVKNLQMQYPQRLPLHVDFYQVNLKEKIKSMIPLVIVGEATAVTEKIGTLLNILSEVEVEALPDNLPESIEISVERLAAIDDQVTVGDLKAPADVVILTDAGQVIVKIAELVAPEPEPEPEAAAEGETAEGASTEEGSTDEAKEEKSE